MNDIYGVIKGPCLTEKGNQLQEEHGQVVIKVNRDSNKLEIKEAVEKLFNVKVGRVRTTRVLGKRKRVGRNFGYTSDWKKAVVTLTEGKIDFLQDL